MIKKLKLLTLTAFAMILMTATVYADIGDYISVGLGSPSTSIRIESTSLEVFFILDGRFSGMGRIESGGPFTLLSDNSFYVFIEDTGGGFSLAAGSTSGREAVPVLLERGTWGVYAGPFTDRAAAQNQATAFGGAVIEPNGTRLILNSGGEAVAIFENHNFTPYFANGQSGININGSYYRGFLSVHRVGTNLTPVNMVSLEEYLFSVVPSEMPASWHIEALKAQAVAARSYARSSLGAHTAEGFNLCANEHCQVYWGMSREMETSTQAVRSTGGLLAFFNDEVINAVYSSSSGGVTDNSENVWSAASPYLRGRSDIYDTTGREWTRTFALSELTRIAAASNSNIGDVIAVSITELSSTGRVLRLTLSGTNGNLVLEKEAIRTFFAPSADGNLSSRNFRISSFTLAVGENQIMGRSADSQVFIAGSGSSAPREVNSLMALNRIGEIGPIDANNFNVQTSAGLRNFRDTVFTGFGLPDAREVQITGGLSSAGNTVTFVGRGWGHGVGLSQHGARGMAEAGYSFEEILKHYYTGIAIRQGE